MWTRNITKKIKTITFPEWLILATVCLVTIGFIKFFGFQNQVWQVIEIQLTPQDWQGENTSGQPTVPHWLIESISPNDVEKATNGEVIAKVLSVEAYEQNNDTVSGFIAISLKTLVNKRTGQMLHNNQLLNIGSNINLEINHHILRGRIIDIQPKLQEKIERQVNIQLRFRYVEPWKIDTITHQLPIMISELKSKRPIITIHSISKASSITTSLLGYNYFNQTRPIITDQTNLSDIVAEATVIVNKQNDRWYLFHNQQLKIGSLFTISTPEIGILNAEVQSINFNQSQ